MSWFTIIGSLLTLAFKLFSFWFEENKLQRAKKREDLKDAIEAIDERDVSKLNAVIQRMY